MSVAYIAFTFSVGVPEASQQKACRDLHGLQNKCLKDGTLYIQSIQGGPAQKNANSKGLEVYLLIY